MQIRKETILHVVGHDGKSLMTLENLHNSLSGGTRLEDIEVFTDEDEANDADRARRRRQQVAQFSRDDLLDAQSMVLLNAEDEAIATIPFCPTD